MVCLEARNNSGAIRFPDNHFIKRDFEKELLNF